MQLRGRLPRAIISTIWPQNFFHGNLFLIPLRDQAMIKAGARGHLG